MTTAYERETDEIVAGYREGLDRSAPWPGVNRSCCYRHGFWIARIDIGEIEWEGSAGELQDIAQAARLADRERAKLTT